MENNNMNFKETTLYSLYASLGASECNFKINDMHAIESFYKTLFICTVKFLAQKKSKDNPVAMRFSDMNDKFLAAFIVTFIPPEDSERPGSYALDISLKEEALKDIPENSIYNSINSEFLKFMHYASHTDLKLDVVVDPEVFKNTAALAFKAMNLWASENVESAIKNKDEGLTITLPDIVNLTVQIDDSESPVVVLTPDENLTRLIKHDASLQC